MGEPSDVCTDVRPVPFVPHAADVDAVLFAMRERQSDMAVVMDEYGGTAGIITRKDLLDEVVGEMPEDSSAAEIRRDPEGRLIVPGTVRLDEVGEEMTIELGSEAVGTW